MSVLSRVSLEESLVVPKTPTAWVVDLPLPGARSLSRSDRMGGRHWLVVSPGTNGQSTQQYYHLPRAWFSAENTLIVFEEQTASPKDVQLERRQASRIQS